MWIENVKITNLSSLEEIKFTCGGSFEMFSKETSFNYEYSFNEVNVEYSMFSEENFTFQPLTFTFKSFSKKDELYSFRENLRFEKIKALLTFDYNGTEYNVFCVISSEEIKEADYLDLLEDYTIKVRTISNFLKIKDYPFKFEDTGVGNSGDQLPVQLPFKLDRSKKNSTEEAIVNFDVEGDLKAFLRVEMYGPESGVVPYLNPKFGLNKLASNTINSFDCKNTPLNVGDLLVVDSFPLRREIKKNGVDFESNALFLEHRCFFGVDPKTKDNRLVFQNCLHGNIKVYNQYRLPR